MSGHAVLDFSESEFRGNDVPKGLLELDAFNLVTLASCTFAENHAGDSILSMSSNAGFTQRGRFEVRFPAPGCLAGGFRPACF